MEPSIYITITKTRAITKAQWKLLYRESRITYREKTKEIRKAIYNLALYGTTTGWSEPRKINKEYQRIV